MIPPALKKRAPTGAATTQIPASGCPDRLVTRPETCPTAWALAGAWNVRPDSSLLSSLSSRCAPLRCGRRSAGVAGLVNRGEIIPSVTGASSVGAAPVTMTLAAAARVSPPYHWPVKRPIGEQPRYSTRYAPRGRPAMMNRPSGLLKVLRVASGPLATTHTFASGAPPGPRTDPVMMPRLFRNALRCSARAMALR